LRSGYCDGVKRDHVVMIAELTVRNLKVREGSLYSMRSLTLSKWRNLKMRVIHVDL